MPFTQIRQAGLRDRAARVIPGGMYGHQSTALLPPEYPQFFSRAKGCRMWDADGNEYIDYMCGYGSNLLGYGHDGVDAAAAAQQARGDTLSGPSEIMVELAEEFVGLVSHAAWAMFCKNGTDATTIAMLGARSHTGRRKILVAEGAYHGSAPWCLQRGAGRVAEDSAHIIRFRYNDPASLEHAIRLADHDVAGVFATPFRHDVFADQSLPMREFAQGARRLCDEAGALLIIDEIRTGLRLARDCGWSALGVAADVSCWGKAIANGYPISAVLGGETCRTAFAKIFATGTFWFSAVPMAAALATLREVRQTDYLERIVASGTLLRDGLARQAESHGFGLRQTGPVQMPQILFADDPDFRLGYCWVAEAVRRGVYLHPFHNMFIGAALTGDDVRHTLERTDEAFAAVRRRAATLGPVAQLAGRFPAPAETDRADA